MERRRFLAALLSVPVMGPWLIGRASGAQLEAADTESQRTVAEGVWAALDHTSSWRETAIELRRYAAGGGAGGDAFSRVARLIDQHAGRDEPAGVLGLYPAAVLTLAAVEALRVDGDPADHRRQVQILRELLEAA